tara:strand:- start:550 stop:777 length:228 start_codon:yes stop_codon:yes gene_type:complete
MEANTLFGRPWKVSGRFQTFEEADKLRKKLLAEENLQVKVKRQLKGYVVKTRSTVIEQPKRISRKKQRKEKMNDR